MTDYDEVEIFWKYLVFYPEEDEEGYDGEHDGGIMGISDDAPEDAKKAFEEWKSHDPSIKV